MKHISRRIGNRGAVLIILGVLWLLTAVGVASAPIARPEALLPYEHLPVWFRVTLWAVPGLVALVAGAYPRWDDTAWALLIVPIVERTLSFVWAWGVNVFDGGYPTAWRGFLVYAATGTLIYFCAAGLDQPPPGSVRPPRDNS